MSLQSIGIPFHAAFNGVVTGPALTLQQFSARFAELTPRNELVSEDGDHEGPVCAEVTEFVRYVQAQKDVADAQFR